MANPESVALRAARQKSLGVGLALVLGLPLGLGVLAALGVLPPGTHPVAGVYQQAGYSFTGIVFCSAAWAAWRKGQLTARLQGLPEAARVRVLGRETLRLALVFESSALCGALYWSLVGWQAARHVLAFLLLTPIMFLGFQPRRAVWLGSRKEVP